MPRASRPQRTTLRQRLSAFLNRLATRLGWGSPRRLSRSRSPEAWQRLRRETVAQVKSQLADEQPLQAIRTVTRALLEDPQHPAYHDLLKKAAAQRRRRRIKSGSKDAWAELPRSLREEALQLEAFSAYVDEVERLFDEAGIPPLSAPSPRPAGRARGGG